MDPHEQVDAFRFDLMALLKRYLLEFDLPLETLIGVMETTKIDSFVDPPQEIPEGPCEWDEDYEDNDDNDNPFKGGVQD